MNDKKDWLLVLVPVLGFVLGGGILINLQNNANMRLASMLSQQLEVIENKVSSVQYAPSSEQEIPTVKSNPAPSKLVTLTSPKNGGTYGKVRITGKTKPGYLIQAYINESQQGGECLTLNTFSGGGAGKADGNGNFDFMMANAKNGEITLVVAALPENYSSKGCFPMNNVSDVVAFTYTGQVFNPQ